MSKTKQIEISVRSWIIPSKYDNCIRIHECGTVEFPGWFCSKYPDFKIKENDEFEIVIKSKEKI